MDLIIIIFGKILQIIIMFLSVKIITYLLSPKEIGNYYLLLTILSFYNLVFLNPPGMYFSRHLLEWEKSKNIFNALFVFIIIMIIVALLSIPINYFLYMTLNYKEKFSLSSFLIFIVLAIIISTTHRNVVYGLNILNYRKKFVLFLVTTLFIGLIFSILLTYFHKKALSWLFGVILSESLILYFALKCFIKGNQLNIKRIINTLTKEKIILALKFMLPIAITTFLMWGENMSYKIIVDYKYSAKVLGAISVGLIISSAVFNSIESISMQYFNPIFYKNIINVTKEEKAKVWNKIAKYMVPIYILTAIFTISFSKYLAVILIDKKFYNSYIYTIIGGGIEFFRVMVNLLNYVSLSEKNTKVTIGPYFLGFILSISIIGLINFKNNYFMIPIILLFSYITVFIYMYFNMKKLLDIKYDLKKVFNALLMSIPLLTVLFLKIKLNIINSFLIILIGGIYYLLVIFFLVKENR